MADYGLRVLKRGLSPEEVRAMTLEQLRMDRLEALRGGEPVERSLPRPGAKGETIRTTSPTLDHMAIALDLPLSSLRAYVSGRNVPRMTIPEMVRFARELGLSVEELGAVVANSRRARVL